MRILVCDYQCDNNYAVAVFASSKRPRSVSEK
jgi:hypothetical protein